jgi:uncharacterized protein (DUF1330 family)
MTAYLIVYQESQIRDEAAMAEYQRRNREMAPGEFKITPLVVYGATQALEGPPPVGVVMLQFPTVEDARAWYDSPAYQAALPYRKKAADYRAIIVEGL